MALYHTYRPTTFDDVAYQAHIIDTLKSQVIHGKVGHAYLFSGPRGVGKTTTARILAKAVNLPLKEGTATFDNGSDVAKEIDGSRSIDVIEIDAASNTGVDNVREHIIENARFQPTSLKKKVFIIDEVHMLSNSAFNALLKTLEEPPAHVMFILATTELHKIPETIISRCQVFRFTRVPFEPMKAHLLSVLKQEHIQVDDDVLARIINKSDGCVRDAMSLLEQILATGETHITKDNVTMLLPTSDISTTLAFVTTLVQRQMQAGLASIQSASSDGVRMEQYAYDTLELLRILMIVKATNTFTGIGIDLSDTAKQDLSSLSTQISHAEVVSLADLIMTRKLQIATSPIPEMPMEMAVIEWCNDVVQDDGGIATGTVQTQQKSIATKQTADSRQQATNNDKDSLRLHETEQSSSEKKETTDNNKQPEEEHTVVNNPSSVVESPHKTTSIDEKAVRTHWNAWMKMIEEDSPTMVFILKMATLKKVTDNVITMSVEYTFHQDKLMNPETKRKIEIAFATLLGSQVVVDVIIEKKDESSSVHNTANTELSDLTAAFGGQVV